MVKTTICLDGMSCAMSEAQVRDILCREFGDGINTIRASARKNMVEILSSALIAESGIREILKPAGCAVKSYRSEPYVKESFIEKLKKFF